MQNYGDLFKNFDFPILLSSPANVYYVTDFYTEARRPGQIGIYTVLMTPQESIFFYPAGWTAPITSFFEGKAIRLIPYKGGSAALAEEIAKLLPECEQLGYERNALELELYLELQQRLSPRLIWTDVVSVMEDNRRIKDAEEIRQLRASASLAKETMEYAKTILSPGKTEKEIQAEMECYMRKRGSSGTPFTMKVLAGENATRTINLAGFNEIHEGEIVLIDFGATLDNHASDWTRSFCIGKPTDKQQELYDLVWKIERSCIEMLRPGVTYKELMDKAFEVIGDHPYAPYFNPYLGHNIGIVSVEQPTIVYGVDMTLQENMVITIEPGIYIPGIGGVRIEDMILITADGHEILTGLKEEGFCIKV